MLKGTFCLEIGKYQSPSNSRLRVVKKVHALLEGEIPLLIENSFISTFGQERETSCYCLALGGHRFATEL